MKIYSALIILLFVGCTGQHQQKVKNISVEKLDTLHLNIPSNAQPGLFETAFTKSSIIQNELNFILYGINIGSIKINTGKVVACDPTLMEEYGIPFIQSFPVGEFPVHLSIAKLEEEETIAYARIFFSDKPVVKWEYALLKDDKMLPITDKDHKGFVVDGGLACFMDAESLKKIDFNKLNRLDAELHKEMDQHYHFDWKYVLHKYTDHDIAAFSTGLGDGNYKTYIGYDINGAPCRLLTDFEIFNWRKKQN